MTAQPMQEAGNHGDHVNADAGTRQISKAMAAVALVVGLVLVVPNLIWVGMVLVTIFSGQGGPGLLLGVPIPLALIVVGGLFIDAGVTRNR